MEHGVGVARVAVELISCACSAVRFVQPVSQLISSSFMLVKVRSVISSGSPVGTARQACVCYRGSRNTQLSDDGIDHHFLNVVRGLFRTHWSATFFSICHYSLNCLKIYRLPVN